MRSIQIFVLFLCVYFASHFGSTFVCINSYAHAENALKVTGVSGASGYDLADGAVAPTIYGGITGDIADCQNAYGTSTACDNCMPSQPVGSEKACNTTRIHNTLVLHIDFVVVADISGPIYFGYNNGGPITTNGSFTVSPSSTTLSKGSTGSVEVDWGTLCSLFMSDSTCAAAPGTDVRDTIYISLDSGYDSAKRIDININFLDPGSTALTTQDLLGCATEGLSPTAPDDGICRFNAKPGDQKVFLDDNITTPDCTVKFKYARFFYSNISQGGSFVDASYGSPYYKDLPFNSICKPDGDWVIDDLNNDEVYVFRSSMVDLANNNVFLNTYDTTLVSGGQEGIFGAQPDCNDADLAAANAAPGDVGFDADTGCTFAARPGEVVGLLPNDFNCFIATAAYGTGFEPKIFIFRKFRDHILLKNHIGKDFVKLYYEYGPTMARFIADKPILRSLARAALWPAWGFSWIALHYKLSGLSVLLLGLLVVLIFVTPIFLAFKARRVRRPLAFSKTFSKTNFMIFGVLFLFVATIFTQAAQAQKVGAPTQPALVRPPDILSDETQPEDVPQIKKKTGIFDDTFKPENRLIEHPNAAKGLIKIDKNRIYQYKVKTSEQTAVGTFHLGLYEPLDLVNPEDSSLTFDELYDETNFPIILYDHEFQFWSKLGRLSWKVGGGFYFAQGNGRFVNLNPDPDGPSEAFSLFIFPMNVGLTYRFQYYDYQWLVPYVEGGGDIFAFAETRDDDYNPSLGAAFGAAPAAHGSVGLSVLLGRNASSFLDLDREYGINTIYLTAEFRRYVALSSKFDFTGNAITGGISAEY